MDKVKQTIAVVFALATVLANVSLICAQDTMLKVVQLTPSDLAALTWVVDPANPNGPQTAILAGDPKKPALYTSRIKIPAQLKVPPHWHPDDRMVLVISGTLYFGHGDTFDETKLKALPAGSFYAEPARQPHFAWAKESEVIIQVTAVGPAGTTPVQ
jgi:Domain of unknown function (DUF4437)